MKMDARARDSSDRRHAPARREETVMASRARVVIDAYVTPDAERVTRSIASSATSTARDECRHARWVARSGGRATGCARVECALWAMEALEVKTVTVEWIGRERARDGRERVVARSRGGEVAGAGTTTTVEPGSTATFSFGIDLPPVLAPSFEGEWMGYSYEITIRATLANGEELEASAPLTVRANGDTWNAESEVEEGENDVARTRVNLAAPWIHVEDVVPPESPRFAGSLPSPRALTPFHAWGEDVGETPRSPNDESAARSPFERQHSATESKSKAYIVSAGDEPLLKVILRKPAPKCTIGGEIAGALDFTCSRPGGARASEVMIALESNEILHAEAKTAPGGSPPIFRKTWVRTSERVEHLDTSHFVMNLPLNSPGSFRTASVELKWLLKFEITSVRTSRAGEFAAFFKGETEKREYAKVEWILPLEVGSDWLTSVSAVGKVADTQLRRESSLVAMP